MELIILLIMLLMFATPTITLVTIGAKFAELKRAGASRSWPSVTGHITSSRIVPAGQSRGQNLYRAEVEFSYVVNGETFSLRQQPTDSQGRRRGPKAWARQVSLAFKPDTTVPIYHAPGNPRRATLQPGQSSISAPRWYVIGGVMLLLSLGMHALSVSRLADTYLNLGGDSVLILTIITGLVTLMVGASFALIFRGQANN